MDALNLEIPNRGKRWTAEYLKSCRSNEILNEIWLKYINNDIELNNAESIDWIRYLMAGGYEPDYFTTIVKKYDNVNKCVLIWNEQTIAYRCHTCSLATCMSMCSECFLNGHHEGHDYKLFRSETGGCCDCGDSSVMQPSGFCKKHSSREASNDVNPPPDLLSTAELIAPRVFARLILHLRRSCLTGLNADDYLTMLCEFCRMGAPMLSVLTSALTDAEIYNEYVRCTTDAKSKVNHPASCETFYKQVLDGFENPNPPPEFEHCPSLRKKLHHKTFLEELVFWTLKYEFPEKMTNFLLAMLPDFKYKEALSEAIILHYCHMAMVLERTSDPETLSKRIVNVTVQWILNQYLAIRMAEKLCLVPVMIVNLKNMIDRISLPAPYRSERCTHNSQDTNCLVIDCNSKMILEVRYWTFVSDLNKIFSYQKLATEFMTNETLMRMWFSVIARFQGMNATKREISHVEYETDCTSAFLAELSTISTSFSSLLKHLKDDSGVRLWKKLLHGCLTALKEWLKSANDYDVFKPGYISFHVPLHRFFTWLIRAGIDYHRLTLREMLPSEDTILSMLQQPLHILVTFFEIRNNLWSKNGLAITNQALTYALKDFCSSMIDTDVYLLQILVTQIPASRFMSIVVEKFQIGNILEIDKCRTSSNGNSEYDGPMLESFLQFLVVLCGNRTYLADSNCNSLIDEIVTQIAIDDRTHSEFEDTLPETHNRVVARDIDPCLDKVAEYQQPNLKTDGNMQQGKYIPKPCVWETYFDPVHVLLRTGVRKELYQNAINRFTDYLVRNKLIQAGTSPWLPYRMPAPCSASYTDPRYVLNTELFYEIVVRSILWKFVHEKSISEQTLSLVVYLLEMALNVIVPADVMTDQERKADIAWLTSSQPSQNITPAIVVNVNESVISLLLRTHSILSGKADSFDPDLIVDHRTRIGDGTLFVGRVLLLIYKLDETCKNELLVCRKRLWPKITTKQPRDKDGHERLSEKKRKIEEKRRKILEMYAKQRQKFVDSHPEFLNLSTEEKMDWQHAEDTNQKGEASQKLYHCGICKKMLPSTMDNPVLLVTLSQASNILGRKRSEQKRLVNVDYVAERMERLSRQFSQARWKQSCYHVNFDGVYVQSCGHYFDRACFSITNENEYLCPVCRQLANGALPVIPSSSDTSRPIRIESNIPVITSLIMSKETSTSLRQLTKPFLDHTRLISNASNRRPVELLDNFSTISTIALTNIELNIAIRGGSLVKNRQSLGNENLVKLAVKKSCLKPLLQVLAKQVTKQNCRYVRDVWNSLTTNVIQSRGRKNVPLLVQDPNLLLVQFVLVLLDDLRKDDFVSCLKYLYSLLYFQIIVQFSYQPNEAAKNFYRWKDRNGVNSENSSYFDMITRQANKWMDDYGLVAERKQPTRFLLDLDEMLETKIRNLCTPFLRIAAILQHYLFDERLPEIVNETSEFECILRYLKLMPSDTNIKDYNSAMAVILQKETLDVFENWFYEIGLHTTTSKSLVDDFVSTLHLEWTLPRLAKPPQTYELVLKRDNEDCCSECRKMNCGGVCLICNAVVCLRKECCKRDDICEGVRHAAVCGAGTGVYLDVLSSQIIVIHLSKAFVWGSLYLDEYDEEDDFLRRGKPLFLSNDRHELLQYQWLAHSFNQIDGRRKWFCHSGSL